MEGSTFTVPQKKSKGCDLGQLENKWKGEYAEVLDEYEQICDDYYHHKGKQITKM